MNILFWSCIKTMRANHRCVFFSFYYMIWLWNTVRLCPSNALLPFVLVSLICCSLYPFFQGLPTATHAHLWTHMRAHTHSHTHSPSAPTPSRVTNISTMRPFRSYTWHCVQSAFSCVFCTQAAELPLHLTCLCTRCPTNTVQPWAQPQIAYRAGSACCSNAAVIMWTWSSTWAWELSLSVFCNKLFKWDVEELIG
jgi:hypothetical protein